MIKSDYRPFEAFICRAQKCMLARSFFLSLLMKNKPNVFKKKIAAVTDINLSTRCCVKFVIIKNKADIRAN